MKKLSYANILFFLILIGFVLYASIFINQSKFTLNDTTYHLVIDDAMVSMRFAKNFANGDGLVWNPGGEKVEGYTNLLWVLYMSFLHLFSLSGSQITLIIKLSGAIFLFLNLFVIKNITQQLTTHWLPPLLSVLLTAFFYPINTWSLMGMEVSILVLVTNFAVYKTIKHKSSDQFSPKLYLLLGISTLIRIDSAVLFIIILIYNLITDPTNRKQHLFWGLGSLFFFLFAQTLFRYLYYGELVPNTYYLKVGGLTLFQRITRGLRVLIQGVWITNWALILLPFSLLLLRRDKHILLLFSVFLGNIAYSVYVGGDAWEHRLTTNRFISLGFPILFILLTLSLESIRQTFLEKEKPSPWAERLSLFGITLFIIGSLISFNTIRLTDNLGNSLREWLLLDGSITFANGSEHYIRMANDIESITDPQAVIAVTAAGNIAYYSDRYYIDILGKSDPIIAHTSPKIETTIYGTADYRPGHNKWDFDYSFTQLQPDVIAQWREDYNAVAPYVEDYTLIWIDKIPYYVKNDSPYILWDNIPEQ